jgi:DNA-directed RNA polymerase specialized sigma24 family protein
LPLRNFMSASSIAWLAWRGLRGIHCRVADEEDVALSAFDSFCRGAKEGRYPQISDRNNLWHLLGVLAERKAIDLLHHERRQKRGGGKVRGESVLDYQPSSSSVHAGIEQIMAPEPTPDVAAQVAEECERLLDRLNPELRRVALWKMEGYTNEEIAAKLGCVPRTVERKLRLIRSRWSHAKPA